MKIPVCGNNAFGDIKYWLLSVGPGWRDIVRETHYKIIEKDPGYHIDQIKEKFGGLRYYASGLSDESEKIIEEAEALCDTVCENCGSRENVTQEGKWIRTLCGECRKKS